MKTEVVNQENTSQHTKFKYSLEYFSAFIIAFFCAMFSLWTIGSNGATIFDLPWKYLSETTKYILPPLLWFSFIVARRFASSYCEGLLSNNISVTLPDSRSLVVLLLATLIIISLGNFINKYYIFAIAASAIYIFSRGKQNHPIENKIIRNWSNDRQNLVALLVIVLIAVSVVLFAHRPDLDDSSFIQIATQTLAHEDRAPLSFDTSLGYVLESFRFAPYRVSSYETLVAFVSDFLNINIYSAYYLFFPAITATLTILIAFVFSRWFFSTSSLAIAATAVFMLVMLAWGETHVAYGNRVFVRLFQGKGLIIALTTPFTILVGLVLVNRQSYFVAGVLALANICAIGVSSSGLIMTIFTSIIVFTLAVSKNFKITTHTWALVAATMIYPILLAVWLKLANKSLISMSDVGTHLPINASLGLDIRESILMISLLLGFSLFILSRNKSYILIIVAICSFILNPWFSEAISNVASKNMSWRLAWAGPLPLLLSIALVAGLSVRMQNKPLAIKNLVVFSGVKIAVITLLLAFLFSQKWVFSSGNNLSWGLPAPKLPNEFYVAIQIADKIRTLNTSGQVLAHRDIAAWLPLTLPGVKLVMPGHTYPIQLQTILPKHEFESRMAMFNAINNGVPDTEEFSRSIDDFNVDLFVISANMEKSLGDLHLQSPDRNMHLEKIESFSSYFLYKVMRGD